MANLKAKMNAKLSTKNQKKTLKLQKKPLNLAQISSSADAEEELKLHTEEMLGMLKQT